MQEYELRISKTDNTPSLVAKGSYLSDYAAVRAAQRLCIGSQCAEVWRGDVCIFADRSEAKLMLQSGQSAA